MREDISSENIPPFQYEEKGDYKKAAELYFKYAEEDYRYGEENRSDTAYNFAAKGFMAAAFCYKKTGDVEKFKKTLEKARDAYKKYIKLEPSDDLVNWAKKRIADIYIELGEIGCAKKLYVETINHIIKRIGNFEEGKPILAYAGGFYEMLAMIYQKTGEFEKALEFCNKAEKYLSSDPEEAHIYIHEPYYYEYAIDFIEELIIQEMEEGTLYFEDNPEIFGKLKDFKTRINLRRRLINREKEKRHS